MSNIEIILIGIYLQLILLTVYARWIYLKLEYGKLFDPFAPTNQYGEGLSEGIQNALVRGQRGISTYE